MNTSNAWDTKGTLDHTGRLDEYKETVSRLFPALPREYVDTWSISRVDALAVGHFLECYPRQVVVLDIGTFVGVSAFHFASQPKVASVISVDPNPTIAEEINDKSDMLGRSIDSEQLQNLRVLDIAKAALAEFGDEQQKIQLHVGTVGTRQVGIQGSSYGGLEKVDIPVLGPSSSVSLLAFVDGLHTKEGVQADLQAIFEKNPHTVVLLDDCRGFWGPFVQAGVVRFMEQAQGKHHFQLLGDLSPSIATSYLGVVYPDMDAAEVRQTLVELSELFTERLDLLRLLRREEELIQAMSLSKDAEHELREENATLAKRNSQLGESNSKLEARNSQLGESNSKLEARNSKLEARNSKLEARNSRLEARNSKLEARNSQLVARYSSRRYKLVDALPTWGASKS